MRISDWSSDVCSSDLKRTRVVKQTSQAQHKGCIHPYVRAASKEWLACSYSFFRIIAPLPLYFVKNGVGRYVCARLVEAWLRFGRNVERSEEHTSELQSLMRISYAVFCLKKNTSTTN